MRRRTQRVSAFRAGLIGIVLVLVGLFFAYTKANPFASPYEFEAVVRNASNLSSRTPVRIAGVGVGRITAVEPLDNGTSLIRMELQERALPIHSDAELKVRTRIFLEGNYFIDLHPGSPSAPELEEHDRIPLTQTAGPVQLGDIVADLQSDTRADLQVALRELSLGLDEQGVTGIRQTIPELEPAYRSLALSSEAFLGESPGEDQQRALRGSQRVAAALARDEDALRGAVTNLNRTAGAFAGEREALADSVPALRDALRAAEPALLSVTNALPSLRSFSREALPGVRASRPLLDAAEPALREARGLVGRDELRGAARTLRAATPSLVELVRGSVPLFEEGRAAARCTDRVLAPFIQQDFPDPDFPDNTGTVNQKLMRSLVGLAGESRLSDGYQSFFHVSLVPEPPQVRPAPPPDPEVPPPHRPDVPCETQEPPNLEMPAGTVVKGPAGVPSGGVVPYQGMQSLAPPAAVQRRAIRRARVAMEDWLERVEGRRARILARERSR